MKYMRLLYAAFVVTAICTAGAAYAFNAADVAMLKKTNSCPGCDLSYANLGNANLGNADLGNANLRWAYLFGANLRGANLMDADLTGANLFGSDLTGATLTGAYLFGATWPDGSKCKEGSIGECKK